MKRSEFLKNTLHEVLIYFPVDTEEHRDMLIELVCTLKYGITQTEQQERQDEVICR